MASTKKSNLVQTGTSSSHALVLSDRYLAGILEQAQDAILSMDPQGHLLTWNRAAERLFGYSVREAVGRPVSSLGGAGWAAELPNLLRVVRTDEGTAKREMLLKRADGMRVEVEVTAGPVQDESGQLIGISAIARDVSERRRAEERLRQSERRFRQMADSAPVMIWMSGPDKLCTWFNKPWLDFTGRTMAQERGNGWSEGVHADDFGRCLRIYFTAFDARQPFTMDYRLQRYDGEYRWILDNGIPLYDPGGAFLGYIGSCIDITDRKRAEEATAAAYEEIKRLKDRLQADNVYLQEEIQLAHSYREIVGQSRAIQEVLVLVEQVAGTAAAVLLLGETGTGKELLARAIHNRSPRHARPMVTLNCAALPPTLVESELFGHEKGAYTGAVTRQIGRFEQADGSTLFLDEVGELPPEVQAKLLRVLEKGEFERLGSTKTLQVDVRIIAASNRDLDQAVREGRFRQDLYYRLNVFPIRLPPLRERREDIALLVWAFVKEFARTLGKPVDSIPRLTLEALEQYPWPGNIRELRNVVERAMIISQGATLSVEIPRLPQPRAIASESANLTLKEIERRHILSVLEQTGWRVSGQRGAAAILGLKPTTLEYRMSKLGIARKR